MPSLSGEMLRGGRTYVERELLKGLHVSKGAKEFAKNTKKDVSNAFRRAASRTETSSGDYLEYFGEEVPSLFSVETL